MPSSVARIARRSVRAGQNIVSQVVVSVAAAVCVAFITNAYLEETPGSPAPAAVEDAQPISDARSAAIDSATEMSNIVIGDDISVAAEDRAPSRPLTPPEASPIRNVAEQPVPVIAIPSEAPAAAIPLPVLPLHVIADLPVRDINAAVGAEIFPGVPAESTLIESMRNSVPAAEQKPERRRFLGLPLPYFVPTAGDIIESASAAGGRIVSIVDRN